MDLDAVDFFHWLHQLGEDFRHTLKAVAFKLNTHHTIAAGIFRGDHRFLTFRFRQQANTLRVRFCTHSLRFRLHALQQHRAFALGICGRDLTLFLHPFHRNLARSLGHRAFALGLHVFLSEN